MRDWERQAYQRISRRVPAEGLLVAMEPMDWMLIQLAASQKCASLPEPPPRFWRMSYRIPGGCLVDSQVMVIPEDWPTVVELACYALAEARGDA